jgi:GNAT superfamily N-acetyltransferase
VARLFFSFLFFPLSSGKYHRDENHNYIIPLACHLKNNMSTPSASKFDLRPMHKNDYDQVVSLLTSSFFRDEPITRCLQVTNTLEFTTRTVTHCLQEGCSFVAYDTQTNQVVAVCLNETERRDQQHEVDEPDEKLHFVFELFGQVHKEQTIFDRMHCDVLLHIFILSVDQVARGHGLATRLIAKSIEHGKHLRVDGAFAEATNVYSLKCFQQQQFKAVNELKYIEYSPERLATMTDPNYDRCYLVTLKF